MRDIKLRAWDKKHKEIIPDLLCFYKDGSISHNNHFNSDTPPFRGYMWSARDLVVMEATGLLDKNGVDIYECDIVVSKSYPFYGDAPEITNSGGKCEELNYVGVVVWCEEDLAYYLDYKVVSNRVRGHACGNMLSEYINLNVIGNIYENPELLQIKE